MPEHIEVNKLTHIVDSISNDNEEYKKNIEDNNAVVYVYDDGIVEPFATLETLKIKETTISYNHNFISEVERQLKLDNNTQDIAGIHHHISRLSQQKYKTVSDEYLTIEDVAELLGITKKTVYNYNNLGILSPTSLGGKIKVYRKKDLLEQLEKNRKLSSSELDKKADKLLIK